MGPGLLSLGFLESSNHRDINLAIGPVKQTRNRRSSVDLISNA